MLKNEDVGFAFGFNGSNERVKYYEPSECPLCHKSSTVQVMYKALTKWSHSEEYNSPVQNVLNILYYCNSCRLTYFCCYQPVNKFESKITHELVCSVPNKYKSKQFDKYITELSPNFVKTYNQSSAALQENLTEVAGMGYRKSLEYLIKDFLIRTKPDDEATIRADPLSKCINMIEHNRIRNLAIKSAWIGNDESHYERTHLDRNINDLITFLDATVNWISSELAFLDELKKE